MDSKIPQHKRMAMGSGAQGMKNGGPVRVPALKTGMKDSPLENVKRANGIPGMKKGGKC